jgi:hypothetical protein
MQQFGYVGEAAVATPLTATLSLHLLLVPEAMGAVIVAVIEPSAPRHQTAIFRAPTAAPQWLSGGAGEGWGDAEMSTLLNALSDDQPFHGFHG